MRFEELTIRGFMAFPDKREQVIKLGKRGIVLVEGANGSGKSSIADALLWCLFGRTSRDVSGDDVVFRHGERGCKVSTAFTTDSGESYRVTRYRGDKEERNKLLFTGPSSGLTLKDVASTEERIREVIGLDFESFTNAVVFGQSAVHFARLTDKAMKQVTDKLVGVEAIAQAGARAHTAYASLSAEVKTLENNKVDVAQLEAFLEGANRDHATWESSQAQKIKVRKKEQASYTKVDLAPFQREVDDCSTTLASEEKALESAQEAVAKAQSALDVAAAEYRRVQTSISALRSGPGVCDACGQAVDMEHLEEHKVKLQGALVIARKANDECRAKLDSRQNIRQAAQKVARAAKDALSKAQDDLRAQRSQVTQGDSLQREIDRLEAEKNPHGRAVKRAEEALEEAKAKNKAANKAIASLQDELRVLEFIDEMFSNKGGDHPPLKALLVESVAPFLNRQLRRYARRLTSGNVAITFNTQTQLKNGEYRDAYAIEAVNRFGASAYAGNSEGERRKIDVAVFLALQDLASSRAREQVRLLIADEVFDALDGPAQDTMVELLLEEKERRDTILVISHREELKAFFPQRLKLVKEGECSRIVS